MSTTPTDTLEYESPDNIGAVHDRLAGSDLVKLVAGGQSLMLMLRQGLVDADRVVDISDVPALSGIEATDERITVKAATTYSELAAHGLSNLYMGLGEAIDVIADEQVRNMGTVGGALSHADPSLDIVPPLLCLDATVTLSSVDGRRTLPLEDFLAGYMTTELADNEVLEAVSFERRDHDRTGGAYQKHTKVEGGWPIVGAGAVVELEDNGRSFANVCIALSAAAYTAVRAPTAESALAGEPVTADAIAEGTATVTEDVDPVDDSSGTVAFKRHLAEVLTRRTVTAAAERAGGELR